jgi:hypothetical protein
MSLERDGGTSLQSQARNKNGAAISFKIAVIRKRTYLLLVSTELEVLGSL